MIRKYEGKNGTTYGVRTYRSGKQTWVGTYKKLGSIREAGTARWAEAQALLSDSPVGKDTVDSFANRWMDDYPRPSESSCRTYRYAVKPLAEHFAGRPLAEVDRVSARKWALSQPKSRVYAARAMFADAMNDGLVTANPFTNLRRDSRSRRPEWIPTEKELRALADKAIAAHGDYGPTFRALILFAGHTGLRPSEVFPLTWDDVDQGRGEIHVLRSLDSTGSVNAHTKNKLTRTVVLPPEAAAALQSYDRTTSPLVFPAKHGGMFGKTLLPSYWHPVRVAYGRPRMRFYDLRHTAATLLLELGLAPHDVAVQLGHTDGGALVMRTYGHPERSSLGRLKRALEMPVTDLPERRGLRGL